MTLLCECLNSMNNLSTLMDILSITFNVNKQNLVNADSWVISTTPPLSISLSTPNKIPVILPTTNMCHIPETHKTLVRYWVCMFWPYEYTRITILYDIDKCEYHLYVGETHDTSVLIGYFNSTAPIHAVTNSEFYTYPIANMEHYEVIM